METDDHFTWETCTSPFTINNISNGSYLFSVRVQGEATSDSCLFTIDQTPPVTNITSDIPPTTSSQQIAAFSFNSSEPQVNYECLLSSPSEATPLDLPLPRVAPGYANNNNNSISNGSSVVLGEWTGCESPHVLLGLYPS